MTGAHHTSVKINEERARRWLSEAEGYLELGLLAPAMERLRLAESSGHCPFECALLHGGWHREKNDYLAAIPFFEKALKVRPGDIPATVGLGWSLKRVGKVELAAEAYEQALKHHPKEGLLHYNLACYRSLMNQSKEALRALDKALKIDNQFRELARHEEDFAFIRDLPQFQKVLGKEQVED